jgi:hypothetical protein
MIPAGEIKQPTENSDADDVVEYALSRRHANYWRGTRRLTAAATAGSRLHVPQAAQSFDLASPEIQGRRFSIARIDSGSGGTCSGKPARSLLKKPDTYYAGLSHTAPLSSSPLHW